MTVFSDGMKTFSDEVFAGKCERSAAVADLRRQTEGILAECRAFLRQTAEDRQAMAARRRTDRLAHRRAQGEAVRAFRGQVRREHQQASRQAREMLGQTRGARQKDVHALRQGFQAAMHHLAADLRAARRFWGEMEARRPGGEPRGA